MKIFLVLVALLGLAITYAAGSQIVIGNFTRPITSGRASRFNTDIPLHVGLGVKGNYTIQAHTPYKIKVCFQDNSQAKDVDVDQCPNGQTLEFDQDSSPSLEVRDSATGGSKRRAVRNLPGAANVKTIPLPLGRQYYIWVAVVEGLDAGANTTQVYIVVSRENETCPDKPEQHYYNSFTNSCTIPRLVDHTRWEGSANVRALNYTDNIDPSEHPTKLITFDLPEAPPSQPWTEMSVSITFSAVPSETRVLAGPFQAWIQRSSVPGSWSTAHTANDTRISFVINGPRPDRVIDPAHNAGWFLLISNPSGVEHEYKVSITLNGCTSALLVGPFCNNTVEDISGWAEDNSTIHTLLFPVNATVKYFLQNESSSDIRFGAANSDFSEKPPRLYATFRGFPTEDDSSSYQVKSDRQDDDAEHNFIYRFNSQKSSWLVAVYPNPEKEDYIVWYKSWCGANCSGNGDCTDYVTGGCSCKSGYKNPICSKAVLKTIYIVLIAIGGAIVLAIAIGVPVGCYIKNRKRARYERV